MAASLVITPEARDDIAAAYGWYECRRLGLGEDFLSSVEGRLAAVCRMPEVHAFVYKSFRRALVRRFPYAIFYEYESGTVTVFAVCQTSQDPAKWRRRLEGE